MKILFLLPQEGTHPFGGFKVVYEYANQLARRKHAVQILHTAQLSPLGVPVSLAERLRIFRFVPFAINGRWKPDGWFNLDKRVELLWVPTLSRMFLPKADAYIATWWTTAERLARFKDLPGRKFYLLQHLETWAGNPDQVMVTWKTPLEKIVIARWLGDIARDLGEASHYIPNGLDFSRFGSDTPIEQRNPKHLAMMFNPGLIWKGSADGLAALRLLKEQYPDLEAEFFGTTPRSSELPSWIRYHQSPAQDELRRIYNRASIFLAPSHTEGWGLPPCEAMMCGAAVVATDIGGHREFAVDDKTALLVPAKQPEAIASAAKRLIEDSDLRIRIANCGNNAIQRFTWEAAGDAMERVLLSREVE
jgi:glycosyltransferase involved in cell wall biosynthesis